MDSPPYTERCPTAQTRALETHHHRKSHRTQEHTHQRAVNETLLCYVGLSVELKASTTNELSHHLHQPRMHQDRGIWNVGKRKPLSIGVCAVITQLQYSSPNAYYVCVCVRVSEIDNGGGGDWTTVPMRRPTSKSVFSHCSSSGLVTDD